MKKKKNKKLFIILGIVLLIILISVLLIVNAYRNKTELTLNEKKWIEENKQSMVDIYIMNDLPIFSSDENDIFLSFLDYFEAETGLTLNKVSYSLSSSKLSADYLFKIINETDDLTRNDL